MFHFREFGNPPTYEEIAGAGAVKEKEEYLGMYNSWFHTEALMESPPSLCMIIMVQWVMSKRYPRVFILLSTKARRRKWHKVL